MKKDWYHKALKLAKAEGMELKDAISLLRSSASIRMNQRISRNPLKIVTGKPEHLVGEFYTIPVKSKRSGQVLFSRMEKIAVDSTVAQPEGV